VSERRACRVLDQPRSSQGFETAEERPTAERLVARMLELVEEQRRFGYHRIWALLRREGFTMNRKRVYRLWRREGLKVGYKAKKRRRLGVEDNACIRRRAVTRNHL
jgi:putative transposase